MTRLTFVAFLAAAGIGAPARYLLDGWVQDHTSGAFPWGTFTVNATGCLALGILTGLGLYHGLGQATRTVVGTAAIGSYTTFSTFTFETVRLAEEGAVFEAAMNVGAGMLVGLLAASAGLLLGAAL